LTLTGQAEAHSISSTPSALLMVDNLSVTACLR
jgi:hypothetical protein